MVVREHYKKFGDIRLLELLYDDLRTWNDWALAKRALPAGKKTHFARFDAKNDRLTKTGSGQT